MKDLDMHKCHHADLFKTVAEGMKEGKCVCRVRQVRYQWKTSAVLYFDG